MNCKTVSYIIMMAAVLVGVAWGYLAEWQPADTAKEEELPVVSKEFVWVRADSLTQGILNVTAGNAQIQQSDDKYVIRYSPKQYLLHENVDGMIKVRRHLTENAPDVITITEDATSAMIRLKAGNGFVYCPAAILGRILAK